MIQDRSEQDFSEAAAWMMPEKNSFFVEEEKHLYGHDMHVMCNFLIANKTL